MWSSSSNCSTSRRDSLVLAVVTPDVLCAASPGEKPIGNRAENRKETSPRGCHEPPPHGTSPQPREQGQRDGSRPGKLGQENSHLHSTNILCGATVTCTQVLTKNPPKRGNSHGAGSVSEDSAAGKV